MSLERGLESQARTFIYTVQLASFHTCMNGNIMSSCKLHRLLEDREIDLYKFYAFCTKKIGLYILNSVSFQHELWQ